MSTASTLPEILVPPLNFAMVCPGVYRSGYPTKKNYPFLRALRLRSVLYLCPEDYAEGSLKFCEESGISVLRFPTEGNKEPFNDISEPLMHRILSTVCDVRNLPVLIHCNKGKHRTGTVVAALRHLQGWSLVSIFEEYKSFAGDKARVGDQQYIELYYPIVRLCPPYVPAWFQPTPRVKVVYSEQALLEEEVKQLGYSLLAPDLATPGKMTFNTVTVGAITTTTSNVLATATASPATTTTAGAAGGVVGAPVTPVTSNNNNTNNNEAVSPTGGMTLNTPAIASTTVNNNSSSSPTAASAGAFASQSVTRTLGGFANAMPSRTTGLTPPAPTTTSHSVPSGSAKMNAMRNAAPPRRSPNVYASSATLPAVTVQQTNEAEEVPDISTTQIGESTSVEAEGEEGEGEGGSSSSNGNRRRGNTALQESSMSLQSPAAAEAQSDSPITATQDDRTHHHHHHKSNNNNNNSNSNENRTASSSGGNNSATLPPTVTAATTCTSPGAKQRDVRRETRSTRKTHSSSGSSTTAKGAAAATTTTASDT